MCNKETKTMLFPLSLKSLLSQPYQNKSAQHWLTPLRVQIGSWAQTAACSTRSLWNMREAPGKMKDFAAPRTSLKSSISCYLQVSVYPSVRLEGWVGLSGRASPSYFVWGRPWYGNRKESAEANSWFSQTKMTVIHLPNTRHLSFWVGITSFSINFFPFSSISLKFSKFPCSL